MTGGEFRFELRVCRWAERRWPPTDLAGGGADPPVVVARQVGTKHRRWDTVVIECDPVGLRERSLFGAKRLDSDLLDVLRYAPTEWTWYRDALPDPGYPWRYVREAIHRASDRGILDERTTGNRIEIRRRWPYPDWIRRIVAIENKPDLDAAAARVLGPQLEHDVAMGLADEAWVATRATGDRVEPALLEDLPVEAGILTVDDAPRGTEGAGRDAALPAVEVAWSPRQLAVDDPGTRILDRPEGGPYDQSAATFEYADPEWKRDKRVEIAERAYERGWRSYVDAMRPDCRHFELRSEAGGLLPSCRAKARGQTAGECSGSCSDFEPEPPAWRSRGWPIEGGPGKCQRRLLDRRRRRRRPGLENRG